ncbi:dTDP-4-dehydrorhamnose 3,5-epimerase [Fictibacillus iocasae]|uniref:dTDP-4-dehydrorhamnose 3,5-epimerase n=1 Tax=Fictibacillus iocasae TaxID=2715437 RepID=A0ABW2NUG8_9BACL
MVIHPTPLHQAVILEMQPILDNRGYFVRSFCKKTLDDHGISFDNVQSNIAYNRNHGTLRGMHFQLPPYCEDKIVSCIQGSIYDVIIDINRESPTFGKWFGITLSENNHMSLYVPKGFAHGYLTLSSNTSIHYMVSNYYAPSYESGVRWDDKTFGINWPLEDNLIISEKDKQWQNFNMITDGIILS